METSPLICMSKVFILEQLSNESLDTVLSLNTKAKAAYFKQLVKTYYPYLDENSDQYVDVIETYISSFYVEKLYRSNRFFKEKFTPIYTNTGLIRNLIADIFYTDDELITH
jgi:hypothetical protein